MPGLRRCYICGKPPKAVEQDEDGFFVKDDCHRIKSQPYHFWARLEWNKVNDKNICRYKYCRNVIKGGKQKRTCCPEHDTARRLKQKQCCECKVYRKESQFYKNSPVCWECEYEAHEILHKELYTMPAIRRKTNQNRIETRREIPTSRC